MHSHANPLCVNENLLHHIHLLLSKLTQELCWSASNDIVWSAFQLTDWFEYLEEAPRHCIWYTRKSRTWAEGKPHGAYSQQHKGLLFQNNMAMSSVESIHTRRVKCEHPATRIALVFIPPLFKDTCICLLHKSHWFSTDNIRHGTECLGKSRWPFPWGGAGTKVESSRAL